MAETFEYAYLTMLNVSSLHGAYSREWVGVLQSGSGATVYATSETESGLSIMNELGQEGWMISDAPAHDVVDNDLPPWLTSAMYARFNLVGIVNKRKTHFLTRRIHWNDESEPRQL